MTLRVWIVTACLLLGRPAAAAPGNAITFDEVLEAALQKSPYAVEVDALAASMRADALALGTLSNPQLSLETRPFVTRSEGRETEFEIEIGQPIRFSDFGARSRAAALLVRVSEAERRIEIQRFQRSLLLAYGRAWSLQERASFARSAYESSQRLSRVIEEGRAKGLVPTSAVKLFQAEREKLSVAVRSAEGAKSRALAELIRQSGLRGIEGELTPLSLPSLPERLPERFASESPVSEWIRLKSDLAHARARVARLDASPDFTPRIAFEHTDEGDDRINIGFSVALPFSDRNQAEVLRSASEARSRRAEEEYITSGSFDDEAALQLTALHASYAELEKYRTEILPAYREALAAGEKELRAGQGDPMDVWQILLRSIAEHEHFLERSVTALEERMALSVLIGSEI